MTTLFGIHRHEIKSIVKNFFTQARAETVAEKIEMASPELIFKIVVISLIALTFLIRLNFSPDVLLSVGLVLLLAYFLLTRGHIVEMEERKENNEKIIDLHKKLNTISGSMITSNYNSVLYKSPGLVKIFTTMLPFAIFNVINFKEALVAANQLVRVHESAKLGHRVPNQTIDIVEALQREVMNNMQSIINSLPTTVMPGYRFQVDLNILQKILQKIVDDTKLMYRYDYEKNGPDIYNPPPSVRSGPWRNPIGDKDYNTNWNFYY